jgi:hypothetical protein
VNHNNKKIVDTVLKNHSSTCIRYFSDQMASEPDVLVFTQSTLFLVPMGVERIKILAVGASGGSGNAFGVMLNNAGEGGVAISNIAVNPGETFEFFVGSKGGDGSLPEGGKGGASIENFEGGKAANGQAGGGGGGGGASGAIRVRGEELIVIAGGGGGGSGAGRGGRIGRGGAGGSFGTDGLGLSPGKVKQGIGTQGGSGPQKSMLGSGGGGGGRFGGGAGSSSDSELSGGGAGGSGTVVGNLSSNGGGRSDGVVMLTLLMLPDTAH